MARKTLIAGNWKMNLLPDQGLDLVTELKEELEIKENLEVVIIPQMAMVAMAADWILDSAVQLGAQNCSVHKKGAFTGETSPGLLKVLGCRYCLSGHSERRELFSESDELVGQKAQAIISAGMTPIVCIGESLEEREADRFLATVEQQLKAVYQEIDRQAWIYPVIAYEPIWAIGTGKTATPDQANEVHRHIRKVIETLAGPIVADAIPVLYGGSAKPSNAGDLLSQPDIDGLLVGGASLSATDFLQITRSY